MRTLKNKTLMQMTMIFIYIPIILWFFMWCNIFVALIATAVSVYGFYQFTKNIKGETEYSLPILVFLTVIILAIFIKCGYCGIFNQHYDWYKTNAVMSDMVNQSSPVYYETVTENGTEQAMLTYYLGIYMFPSLFGKIFGLEVCGYVLLFQAVFTVILIYLNLCKCLKAKSAIQMMLISITILFFNYPMVLLKFVSSVLNSMGISSSLSTYVFEVGLETFPVEIYNRDGSVLIEYFSTKYTPIKILEFRGVYMGQLSFLPYYVIMLITLVWYDNRDKLKSYMFIWIPMTLYCCLAIPYIFFIVVSVFIYRLIKTDKKIPIIRDNLIGIVAFIPIFAYLSGNIFSEKTGDYNRLSFMSPELLTVLYLLLCLLPLFLSYKANKKSKIYYVTIGLMAISCFLSFGRFNDLMLTGTIPLVALSIIFVLKRLVLGLDEGTNGNDITKGERVIKVLLVGLILMGTVWVMGLQDKDITDQNIKIGFEDTLNSATETEVWGYSDILGSDLPLTIYNGYDTIMYNTPLGNSYGTMGQFANRYGKYEDDLKYNYFTYDYPDSLFYKFFARK